MTAVLLDPHTRLRSRYVPYDAITPGLVEAWRDLAGRAAEPNPFQTPDVVLPTFEHLRRGRRVGLLVVGGVDRLDALLAVVSPMRLPPDARRHVAVPVVQALTEPYAQLGTPLVDAATVEESTAALIDLPMLSARGVALVIRYFSDDGPVAAALDSALARRGLAATRVKTYERAILAGGPRNLGKNRRSRVKRARRDGLDMAGTLGELRWQDRAGDPAAVEEFLALEGSGWKGEAGTALASRPETAAWFRAVCSSLSGQGELELEELSAGGRVAAMQCNIRQGDWVFHVKSAYAEDLEDHRPGVQMLARQLELAGDHPGLVRDSVTAPDNVLFNQLWPDRRRLSTLVVPGPGHAGAWVHRGVRLALTARGRVRARGQDGQADGAAQASRTAEQISG
ncbi:MAG: hypothetical protein JWQ53_2771 [Klenkia sp.]|nr:hypothetical protein [Klenkia sp.]